MSLYTLLKKYLKENCRFSPPLPSSKLINPCRQWWVLHAACSASHPPHIDFLPGLGWAGLGWAGPGWAPGYVQRRHGGRRRKRQQLKCHKLNTVSRIVLFQIKCRVQHCLPALQISRTRNFRLRVLLS